MQGTNNRKHDGCGNGQVFFLQGREGGGFQCVSRRVK